MGTLYIVATPIGNLEDMTFRAVRMLREADIVLCEDTRVTKKLLAHFKINTQPVSYHQHSLQKKTQEVLGWLEKGRVVAVVSDAGTPGVSDPGNQLVREVSKKLPRVAIVPIPGVSAVTALASIAGIPMDRFLFLGFPPAKKGRTRFFEEIAVSKHPVIFYESPYRIIKSLRELQTILHATYKIPDIDIVVGRELTKKFETVYRGTIPEVLEQLGAGVQKGEFAVAVYQGEN